MAISTSNERLGYASPNGCIATGLHREVVPSGGTTKTLTQEQSGSMVLFDSAAGITYTLPTPVEGMQFEFFWTTQRTSSSHKFITTAASFLVGSVMAGDNVIAQSGDVFEADGTTIRSVVVDGDTKGGFIGGHVRITAISATQWAITGLLIGTGTMATPFATS